ncbi:MAG: hypothetical protein U0531_18580 [Dehalococcoidia bacterium]
MAREAQTVDITSSPDLLRLAHEVQRSGRRQTLVQGDEVVAELVPPRRKPARAPKAPADAPHDPLLDLIGIGASAQPTNMAQHKRDYLAEAFAPPADR